MATASTFSYAQAAKGQGSSAPSNAASQAQESLPATSGSQTKTPVEHSSEPIDVVQNGTSQAVVSEKQDVASNSGVESDAQTESARGTQREAPRDDESGRLDRPWRQNDKGTRSSSNTTRSIDEQDSRKQRRSKKAKGSEKTPAEQTVDKEQEPVPEPPKVELSEAPIPSVNIWQQRKEAQLAKVKPAPAGPIEQSVSGLTTNGAASTKVAEDAASVTSRDHATNGTKSLRKPGDAPRAERSANRGSRVAERGDVREGRTDSPPLVSDATAWPTPETAIKEEKKKPAEQVARPEKEKDATEDGAHAKPRQKEKWVTYDYVPTVNFETQLPQLRSSKPRSPRTPNPRGTTSTTGEKTATSAQPPKTTEARDRPRENAAGPSRATMSPPQTKRTLETPQAREQKKQPVTSVVAERPKETAPTSSEQSPAVRERPEGGRGERGRGGFRGRGGHHSVNSHHQQHVGSGFAGTGPLAARPQGPYSPPNRQVGHGQAYIPQQRGGRAGRGNGGNGFHRMSLPNGAPRVSALQTHYRAYDYPMAISAMPFQPQPQPQHQPQPQPYWDNMLVPLLKSQIEYYFSIENLCKDMYLRAHMDSQGFVPLAFIAAFKRVRDLSADIGFIRAVCEMSTEIDFVVGDDDMERVRRRKEWEKFILPLEDRDDFSRNHGPARFTYKNRGFQMPPQFNDMAAAYGMASPPAYPVPGEIPFQQMPDESVLSHGYSGHANGHAAGHGMTSQLSADVPDFSPSATIAFSPQPNGVAVNGFVVDGSTNGLANGVHEQPDGAQSA